MHHFLDLAPELQHGVMQEVGATDLAALARTCRYLNSFIAKDTLLWKTHFLRLFDAPRTATVIPEASWRNKLAELVKLQKILESHNPDVKHTSLSEVASKTLSLLGDVPKDSSESSNLQFLSRHLARDDNVSSFLSRSSLFKNAGLLDQSPATSEEERQLSAKLHVLYGVSIEPSKVDIEQKTARPIHPYARSRVYDLRRYTDHNFWGPFMDDGSQAVDWEKVQAIMVVLNYNLQVLSERTDGQFNLAWDKPFAGLEQGSFIPRTIPCLRKQPRTALDDEDPYGVTGTWMRIVCFLDYHNLYSFNFESEPIPQSQEREPIDTEEAIRLIFLTIRVTRIEPPGEEDGQDMPVVHFTGTSKSMHMSWDPNANSRIRGTVRTTPTGAVRWTTFSIYHGEERWRSEGVQIGGRCSQRGVLGTWFDKDYDEHGPAGPSAFWKLSDVIAEEKASTVHSFPFSALF